jgi:hypothetical protein
MGSNAVLAGIDLESTTHRTLISLSDVSNVTIRNNKLSGGKNDAFNIGASANNIIYSGNDINSGSAGTACSGCGSTGGHTFTIGPYSGTPPNGVTIRGNRIRGSFFGDVMAGDDAIAVISGNNVVIEDNWIADHYNIEQILDIKQRNSTSPVTFRNNVVENNFLGTKGGQDNGPGSGGPCIVIGDHDSPSALKQHKIEGNWFEDCAHASNPANDWFISIGDGNRPGSALVRNNVYYGRGAVNPNMIFNQAYNTLVLNNTIFRGGFKIGRSGGCIPANHLTFKNNIFYETYVNDQTDSCPGNKYALLYNDLYNLPKGFERGNQANNITANPQFVDSASGDFALKATSPAIDAGENGVDMGANPSSTSATGPHPPSNLRISLQ